MVEKKTKQIQNDDTHFISKNETSFSTSKYIINYVSSKQNIGHDMTLHSTAYVFMYLRPLERSINRRDITVVRTSASDPIR